MLDIKKIRKDPEFFKQKLATRNVDPKDIDEVLALDEKRRELLQQTETLKAKRNAASKKIGEAKRNHESADDAIAEMRQVGEDIKKLDVEVEENDAILNDKLAHLPNVPRDGVPVGPDEDSNREEYKVGEPTKFAFEPKHHWDLGEKLGILDFDRAAKVSGARFVYYVGLGAQLERAVYNFMLDQHTEKDGYTEVIPPYIVNRDSMTGTGQLPKFYEDMYKLNVEGEEMYMIPTAEVPLTNYYRGEIIDGAKLPVYFTAMTPCFRAEAGSAGRDTRGLIRQHQFHKVEMVKYVAPETSYDELDKLTNNAEDILKALGLPYHVVCLCTGDIGFSAAKTFDVEVWFPAQGKYREISSCSNTEDFQARRANIRFRRTPKSKPEFVHTLNGSGLAVGRTVAAILENYQQADGSVIVPEVLRPYMHCDVITKQ